MNVPEHNVDKLLEDFYRAEVVRAPREHRLRKDDCPQLTRLSRAFDYGWAAEERDHVEHCQYCARVTAMQLDESHPPLPVLLEHLALMSASPELQNHLTCCRTCALLLRSQVSGKRFV